MDSGFSKKMKHLKGQMYGHKVLTSDHQNYTVTGARNTEESAQNVLTTKG